MTTALEICNNAVMELGLPALTTVYGTAATTTGSQVGAILNRVGRELMLEYDWTALATEFVIDISAPTDLTGSTAANSRTMTVSSTAGLSTAYAVTGEGLIQSTRIAAVVDGTTLTLNQPADSTETLEEYQFVRDTFGLPEGLARYVSDTWWDRTNQWMLIGPITPQQDAFNRSGIVQSGPRRRWRQIGPGPVNYRIWPPPTGSDAPAVLTFEYVSKAWAVDQNGDRIQVLTDDDDTPLIPEDVLTLGLKAKFWQIKGFDWKPLYNEYLMAKGRASTQDGGRPTIIMGRPLMLGPIDPVIADGNWPDGS